LEDVAAVYWWFKLGFEQPNQTGGIQNEKYDGGKAFWRILPQYWNECACLRGEQGEKMYGFI
jgi:hypothetical protein